MVDAYMSGMDTGSKVSFTVEAYGTVETLTGVVLYTVNDSAYVMTGNSSRMIKLSKLIEQNGTVAPIRGKGIDGLRFITRELPEGHPVRQVAECLLFQATGGNCKIGNSTLAIVNGGTPAKLWSLIRGILSRVENPSQWSSVRHAADEASSV